MKCSERADRRDEESRLLGVMAEKCFTAHSLEELLPLALEAAMQSLHAKRGSILLAEEKGRITAGALRGDHAQISGTIKALQPGTVSHEVFFNRRPRLVVDIDREPGLKHERQFPYGSRSFVSVPLRENGHTLGVLHLTEREGEGAFSQRDLALLERLGRQASGAIRKAWLEQEVENLRVTSSTDHLTGAHNRRFFEEQLGIEFQRALRFGQPLAVAMVDVDDFKALNDDMGHEYGDSVLKGVAAAMRQQLRSVDILSRYGGDEFVLILPGTGAAGALNTIEKIRAKIASMEIGGDQPSSPRRAFTVSAGLAVFPDMVDDAADLLRRADEALYMAKKSGRNTAQLWIH
jgi:diguanylate cyclase (GGDEF)-like protein